MAKDIHVLFLDDEESILSSIKRTFINAPFGITVTTDAREAMAILARENIKVVLSDHRMPKITGVKFLQNVKERFPDVMRILFTGYAEFSAAEEAINIGEVYRFISKPWNTEELKAAVAQAVAHYDLVTENKRLFEETRTKKEELEVANKKLRALYEVQKEFTSTVSHELKTPLASIKMAIDLLVMGTPGPINEDQKDILGTAKNNIDRLSRLVKDILDLSKMEAGKFDFQFALNDINQLMAEVAQTHERSAETKGLKIILEQGQNIPAFFFDRDKISQVLNNLISNAVKFTEEGQIIISSVNRPDRNYVEGHVRDTGCGIIEEDRHSVFEKFRQLGDSASNKTGGTGLGLAICKEIVKQHGGKIWVTSEQGKGSCFSFLLPVQERREGGT
jgi:signal transduction histidine kinase